jgi:predicted alpha-1,2-mannosidase
MKKLIFVVAMAVAANVLVADDPVAFVDPFVGTAGTGHTFPGACMPFGLVQASPETGMNDWKYCSGYQYADTRIQRFGQTQLSGTGCGDLGDAAILPFTGETLPADFSSAFRKETEKASPGFYHVTLDDFRTDVEITATEHVAFYRLRYPGGAKARLLVDPAWLNKSWGAKADSAQEAEISVAGDLVTGRVHVRQWVDRVYYFALRASRPFTVAAKDVKTLPGAKVPGMVLDFAPDAANGKVCVRVALSSESIDGAVRNLKSETDGRGFDEVRRAAEAAWRRALAGAEILEGTVEQKKNFYTALYHLYQQPNNIADAGQTPRMSTLSMWDVFRAACPWYALMKPEVIDGIVASSLRQYDEVGYVPVWQLWGKDNHCMIGNHSVPVLVDAYFAGRLADPEKAYRAVKDSLTKNFKPRPKDRFDLLDKYGYYPFDLIKGESVSRTLECAYDDWCASRFAAALGKADDAAFFAKRAGNWRNVYDATTGFMRGRDTKGNWRTPFDPYALGHGASTANDFTEGNSFQYSWHVLHDVPGLVAAMGGKEAFAKKLDGLFAAQEKVVGAGSVADVTGLIGQYAHGNEPSHHVAYLYPYVGRGDRTAEIVREVFDRFYAPKPDGLCGNDDCGQMSAWYVFSALGFYPVDPISGECVLGAPQVAKARLTLPNGKTFTVEAKGLSRENKYVKRVLLNGQPLAGFTLKRSAILSGGTLVFEMTNRK